MTLNFEKELLETEDYVEYIFYILKGLPKEKKIKYYAILFDSVAEGNTLIESIDMLVKEEGI